MCIRDRWWRASFVLVETKANGEALIDDLKTEIPGLIGFLPDPHGDKVARAQVAAGFWAGVESVWLPGGDRCPWINDFCNELAAFPGSLNKDRVDAMSQIFLHWQEARGHAPNEALVAAMDEIAEGELDDIGWG